MLPTPQDFVTNWQQFQNATKSAADATKELPELKALSKLVILSANATKVLPKMEVLPKLAKLSADTTKELAEMEVLPKAPKLSAEFTYGDF